MDFYVIVNIIVYALYMTLILSSLGLIVVLYLYLRKRFRKKHPDASIASSPSISRKMPSLVFSNDDEEEPDITTYETKDIFGSGLFSASERRMEYRRRGKSPSGVIDGVYNDMYRENGHPYSDVDRDWDADA